MTTYDAVLIGAGHNALACAAHLARKSWKVALFEAAPEVGGAIKTAELTAPGFRHDWAAMNLSLFAGSAFHKDHAAELAAHGLAFAPASDCFASVFPDGRWLGVSTDMAQTLARIEAFSPRDAAAWKQLAADFPRRAEHLFALLGRPMRKRELARWLWALWRREGTAGALDLVRFLLQSPRSWLDETFESEQVKALLAAWGMHLDFAPDIAAGALFPYLEGMACQHFGMVIGQGGADTMTRALRAMVESAGGVIECGARVERILQEDGRASGVVLEGGRQIRARKAVIGSIAPRALQQLLPQGTGDARFDRAMRQYRHAPGTMMIHLAVSDLPDWPDAALRRFAYVHLAPSLEVMAQSYAQATAGLLPAEPVVVVGQPTAIDPSRAPEGQHVLWLQVRMAPGEIRGDAAGQIQTQDWEQAREPFAQRVLDLVERYAPGLQNRIVAGAVFSPPDLESENANLVGGDQICGSHHLAQNFLFRPAPGAATWNTPLAGLHLIGAATWPGAGVGAGSGYMLARQLTG